MSDIYSKERDELVNSFFERYFFNFFRKGQKSVELFIRGTCPNNCKYCYLKQQGEKLYPLACQNEETILKNLRIFCEWYISNHFCCEIEIFSGEMITNGLFFKVMDIFYEYFSDEDVLKPAAILMPEDGNFLDREDLIEKVQSYLDKFRAANIEFAFSLSIDGKYVDSGRTERTEQFYKNAISFADKNHFCFHPMVSARNIDKWIDNYKWWNDQDSITNVAERMMMLEVRNDDWTQNRINNYLIFLNYVIETEFKKMGSDKVCFAKRVFDKEVNPVRKGYDNVAFYFTRGGKDFDDWGAGCSIQHCLFLRLGDLSVVPCHRLGYKDFVCAQANVVNDKITDFTGKNIEFLTAIQSYQKGSAPKCRDCIVRGLCSGTCFGSNYESNHDPFMPCGTVCNLLKARHMFMVIKYHQMGILEEGKKIASPYQWETIEGIMKEVGDKVLKHEGKFSDPRLATRDGRSFGELLKL